VNKAVWQSQKKGKGGFTGGGQKKTLDPDGERNLAYKGLDLMERKEKEREKLEQESMKVKDEAEGNKSIYSKKKIGRKEKTA